MSCRNLGVLLIILVACCLLSSTAEGQEGCGLLTACDPDFYGWGDASGNYNPPTVSTCYAYRSSNQACRACVDAYYDDGRPKGYRICAFVERNGLCYCSNAGTLACSGTSSCRYFAF